MDVLGNVTKWAMANAHPLLDNATMVGGDPAKREPYGYVHSIPAKSIVTLRNPFVSPQIVKLNVDEQNGFQKFAGEQVLEVQYPYRKVESLGVKFGQTLTFNLDAYEEIVAELRPGTGEQLPPSTARPAGKDISFSPAALYRNSNSIRLSTTINVPGDYPQARIAVLLEPNQETRWNRVPGGQRQRERRDQRVQHEGQLARQTHHQLCLDRGLMNGDLKAFRMHASLLRSERRTAGKAEQGQKEGRCGKCDAQAKGDGDELAHAAPALRKGDAQSRNHDCRNTGNLRHRPSQGVQKILQRCLPGHARGRRLRSTE